MDCMDSAHPVGFDLLIETNPATVASQSSLKSDAETPINTVDSGILSDRRNWQSSLAFALHQRDALCENGWSSDRSYSFGKKLTESENNSKLVSNHRSDCSRCCSGILRQLSSRLSMWTTREFAVTTCNSNIRKHGTFMFTVRASQWSVHSTKVLSRSKTIESTPINRQRSTRWKSQGCTGSWAQQTNHWKRFACGYGVVVGCLWDHLPDRLWIACWIE